MSRDLLTFSPTRAAYSACVTVVFCYSNITQIVLLILSSNFVLRTSSLGGLVRFSALCYHTVNLCSLRGCKTKFRLCMKPRHEVMLLTVFMLFRIIRNFLEGISFLYVGHFDDDTSTEIFLCVQPTVWTWSILFAVEMDASLNQVRNLVCALTFATAGSVLILSVLGRTWRSVVDSASWNNGTTNSSCTD
jgi:hypothetical protein